MRIVVAGASGFLGRHLVRALRNRGDDVVTLVRRPPAGPSEAAWEPAAGVLPIGPLRGADAVVNLCGAGVGDRRWTAARRRVLLTSRTEPTAVLARACVQHGVKVLINASAVGYYGPCGTERVTESHGPGSGFLAQLCVRWEETAQRAAESGVRVALLRTGLVLGPDGGMLPRLARITRLGLGGRLGSGEQYWPWISVTDHVAATLHLLRSEVRGPVNLTAPEPVTNAEFTAELGRALGRPTPWVVPSVALRAALGAFAGEIVTGQRAVPEVLERSGFAFLHADLATALRAWAPAYW